MDQPADHGDTAALAPRMTRICGADNVITDPQELRTYECDGLTAHRCSPGLVVLPESAEQVAADRSRVRAGGHPVHRPRQRHRPVRRRAAPRRRRADRDVQDAPACWRSTRSAAGRSSSPASPTWPSARPPSPTACSTPRTRPARSICSVGGNVAENSGGAHCLKHGFTVHHVTGLRDRHPGRRADLARRRHRRRARLRPARRVHRLRGHAGHRHEDHREADPDPGGGHDAAGRVHDHGRGRRPRCRRSSARASCPRRSR